MLYIGHFSFHKDFSEVSKSPEHGYFTLVAEASDMGDAAAKFEDLILSLADSDDVFDGISAFYLDACVECKDIPAPGFLAYYSSTAGQNLGTIGTAVRGANEEEVSLYGWGASEDVSDEVVPFLELED